MDERRLELKVGALVLAAVMGVLVLLWLMGELSLGSSTVLPVDFGHTGNVVEGAPVKLGGVQVGRVQAIRLMPERRDAQGRPLPVRMELAVSPESLGALRSDARVTVATVGLLGEPYLELNPGTQSSALPAGQAVRGTDAPRLDLLAEKLSRFIEMFSEMLEKDPEAVTGLVANISRLTRTLDEVLTENRGDVKVLASELAAASKDLRQLSQLAREALQPGGKAARLLDDAAATAAVLRGELPGLTKSAGTTLDGLAALTGSLGPEDGQRVKLALEKLTAAAGQLDSIAARADRVLARIEAGEGTAGAVLQDPTLYDELRTLVTDLRKHPWKILWKD
ncbi:MlaD family protein [Myxococcus faecalis]|jgi:phospholipid/cholesterol/gamma-HCH transport system substrate-binding protein|uniref:MlaD family protein n=1 Tax=Myxococcus TaxID=32 RepID=UPI000624DD29|nr:MULTISPECIES: MlaD family protein [unclassified Myxococcus]AKF81583.1 mammalian cell entry protein [Myxococcus fulvus 124B02]MBZ4397299.1 MlaD family protein [Myxococcus sp. AS-1-15]